VVNPLISKSEDFEAQEQRMLDELEKMDQEQKSRSEITQSIKMMEQDIATLNEQLKAKEKSELEGQEELEELDEEILETTNQQVGKRNCFARAIMDFIPNGLLACFLVQGDKIS